MFGWIRNLNIAAECRAMRWKLRECPPFLFLLMGIFILISVTFTWVLALRFFIEPEIGALLVLGETVLLLILGNLVITGFNRVASSNRMKSEFISVISHQLRSPLSIFKWTVDILEIEAQKGRNLNELSDFMRNLRDSTEKMIRLVNSLLEVSRIETENFILKKEYFSPTDLVRSTVEGFQRFAEISGINLKFEGDSVPKIYGDRERIAMALENLIDNALRYTPGRGAVTVKIESYDNFIRFSVADQGVGIPKAEQKFLFQKFFRAANASRTHASGVGIGLYIVKAIVEASEGKVGFKSEEGKGSIFWFILPIK